MIGSTYFHLKTALEKIDNAKKGCRLTSDECEAFRMACEMDNVRDIIQGIEFDEEGYEIEG